MKWVGRAIVGIIIGACIVFLSWAYVTASNSADLRKQERGYCVALGGERITDGKCQVGDKVVVITGLDK